MGELADRLERNVDEALACGDTWTVTTLRTSWMFTLAWLRDHEPDEIRGWIDHGMRGWTDRAYHNQHWFACTGLVLLDMWQGRGRAAFDRIERELPLARRALKFKMEVVRVEARSFRARAALMAACGAEPAERARFIEVAATDARWLRRAGPEYATSSTALIEAAIADLRGDRARCAAALEEALSHAEGNSLGLLAAVARIRLGTLRGAEGQALVEAGEKFRRAQGVRDSSRMAAVFCPTG